MKIEDIINPNTLVTYDSIKLDFKNQRSLIGFFERDEHSDKRESEGKIRFIEKPWDNVKIIRAEDVVDVTVLKR